MWRSFADILDKEFALMVLKSLLHSTQNIEGDRRVSIEVRSLAQDLASGWRRGLAKSNQTRHFQGDCKSSKRIIGINA